MTKDEINEAVARGLGIYFDPCTIAPGQLGHPKKCIHNRKIKNYCADIRAAWEVVEKFKEYQIEKLKGPTEYYVRLGNVADKAWAKDDIMPMAICLAYLKLQQRL